MRLVRLCLLLSCMFAFSSLSHAQVTFTKRSDLLQNGDAFFSGVAVAVTDLNGDGRDDLARLSLGKTLQLDIQGGAGRVMYQSLPILAAAQPQWTLTAGDVNNDNRIDLLTAGNGDGVKVMVANSMIVDDYSTMSLPANPFFAQTANFADIDNDGFLDAFVCDDDGISKIFLNDQAGNFMPSDIIDLSTEPASDNSGNYGSIWSDIDSDGDLDLYIAKCRQGASSPTDPRRINQLFINNGDGTYTEQASGFDLAIGAQSWSADFGDYDNDGDFDCFITNHDFGSQLLENIDNTHFEDVTSAAGIAVGGVPLQGLFRDFDNDGYLDILVAGTQSYLYVNNADGTFAMQQNPLQDIPFHSCGIGDLNGDGFLDVYAMYQILFNAPNLNRSDALWINDGNDNNYIRVLLRGTSSNRDGIGARIEIFGPWGVQTREVRAGESYGITNSFVQHFGLANHTNIDSLRVSWPSGTIDLLENAAVNRTLLVTEGGCMTPQLGFPDDVVDLCQGEMATLTAMDGFSSYLWSTGDTTISITTGTEGVYHVSMTDDNGCAWVSGPVQVLKVDLTEMPDLEVVGDTVTCAGAPTILVAPEAEGYLWSTGENTSSITVSMTGEYSVTLFNACGAITSMPVQIEVLAPDLPTGITPDTIMGAGQAVVSATGDSLFWFDSDAGGNLLGEGDSLVVPFLEATDTFYVENRLIRQGARMSGGMPDHDGGSAYSSDQFNGSLIFDVSTGFTLETVLVYTDFYGERSVVLLDSLDNPVFSKTFDIQADTAVLDLGWYIPAGNNYALTTDQSVNQISFGVNSPKLFRSENDVVFPYSLPNVLRIKNSNLGMQFYYYFFDWQIALPDIVCASDRVPVEVVVDSTSSVINTLLDVAVSVDPNPVTDCIRVRTDYQGPGEMRVSVMDLTGRMLKYKVGGQNSQELCLGEFEQGLYLLHIEIDGKFAVKKIVVQAP